MQEPKNKDFEMLVVSGMLNNKDAYYQSISELDADYFTSEECKFVFQMILQQDKPTSANVLKKETKDPKQKSAIQTIDSTWTTFNDFEQSLEGLKKLYRKRQLYYSINKLQSRFDEADIDDLVGSLMDEISQTEFSGNDDSIVDPEEYAVELLGEFQEIVANPDLAKGIPFSYTQPNGQTTGFPSLDKAFNGAQGGDLIMIAGKTGHGKTGLGIQLSRHFSFRYNYRGYYSNAEMTKKALISRMLAPIANVKAREISDGQIEGNQKEIDAKMSRISEAFDLYRQSNLIISRIPDLPLHKAKGLAKQVKAKYNSLDYMVVDYVGRMEIKGFDGSPWDELYKITKELKELAMTLNIPIFMLAQRNQAGDVEGAKKMMNECDGVLFFEPINEDDQEYIQRYIHSEDIDDINYKITKQKVRRDSDLTPIYCIYDKDKNLITEGRKANEI